jgi:hypothetical protein
MTHLKRKFITINIITKLNAVFLFNDFYSVTPWEGDIFATCLLWGLKDTALPLLLRKMKLLFTEASWRKAFGSRWANLWLSVKIFQIFLHQITLEAIIRMGMFVWAVRSQGLEPSAKCFYNMHELLYEMKATGKEQYHNNFGCYGFIARSNASYPVPTYRKRWPGA